MLSFIYRLTELCADASIKSFAIAESLSILTNFRIVSVRDVPDTVTPKHRSATCAKANCNLDIKVNNTFSAIIQAQNYSSILELCPRLKQSDYILEAELSYIKNLRKIRLFIRI